MKKKYLITLGLMLTAGLLVLYFLRPMMPKAWHRITLGMPRDEVHGLLPDLSVDMYELKGFDVTHSTIHFMGENYTWTLTISYDQKMRVSDLSVFTANSVCGCLDYSPISLGR